MENSDPLVPLTQRVPGFKKGSVKSLIENLIVTLALQLMEWKNKIPKRRGFSIYDNQKHLKSVKM